MTTLFTYRMTNDTGFAPNPFHGVLTLATCKPAMRRLKGKGDWIAGVSSSTLQKNAGVAISRDALIWIGKISEAPINLNDYFHDKRFEAKKPSNKSKISRCGDNIYKIIDGQYVQDTGDLEDDDKPHQYCGAMEDDLKGENALIFEEFYYLGDKNFLIPSHIKINIPYGAAGHGHATRDEKQIENLINYIKENYGVGQIGEPCVFGGGTGCSPCGTRKKIRKGSC